MHLKNKSDTTNSGKNNYRTHKVINEINLTSLTSADAGPEPTANVNVSGFSNNRINPEKDTVNRYYAPENKNDTTNLGKNIINETAAESRLNTDTAEAEVKETEEKRIMRSKALRAVNPNSPDAQNVYRGIMRNYGYGDMVSKMDAIAKKLGSEVQFYADNTKSEGYNENNVIHLNVNNLRSTADGVWKVFKHELTHSLEGTNAYGELLRSKAGAELFNEFLKKGGYTVTDAEGNTTTSVEVLKNEIRKLYAKNNVELSAEQLNHECIAKFIEQSDILTSEESIQRLAEGSPNFALRIYNWIKDTIAKFGASPETKMLMEAERLYAKALRQAAKGEYQYNRGGERQNLFVKETNPYIIRKAKSNEAVYSAEDIWFNNGVKRDSRGNWITEIDDSQAKFDAGNVTSGKLSDVLTHDALYSIYPDAANIGFEFKNMPARKKGSYSTDTNTITLNSKFKNSNLYDEAKTTIIHELQHYLQYAEGRSVGGSRNSAYTYLMNDAYRKYSNDKAFKNKKDYMAKKRYLENRIRQENGNVSLEKILYNKYRAIEGEEEARAAAGRKDLDASERRYDYPEYGGKGIDLTSAEKYTEDMLRNVNGDAMGRQSVNPAALSLYQQLGGRVYDEGLLFTGDRRNEPGDIIRRGNFEGTLNNTSVAKDRNPDVKEGTGEKSGRQVQALQNEQISEKDAQISGSESYITKGSKINRNEGQAGNDLFFNGEKQYSFADKEQELNKKSEQYLHRATNTLLNEFLEITGADGFTDKNSLKADINLIAQESAANGKTDRAEGEKLFDMLYNGAENNRKAYADAKNEFMSSLNRFEQGINDVIRYILGENNEVKAFTPEALYAGALGAISGGMFEVPGAIKTGAEVKSGNAEGSSINSEVNTDVIKNAEEINAENIGSETGEGLIAKIKNNADIIKGHSPVSILTGAEFPKGPKKLTEQVGEFFRSLGNKVFRQGFGDVVIDENGIKDSIAHGIGRAKAVTFAAVPDVISKGVQIDYSPNWKGRGYDTYVFAAPVKIGNQVGCVGVVVAKKTGGNRYYLHEVLNEDGEILYINKNGINDVFKTGSVVNNDATGTPLTPNNGKQVPNANAFGTTSETDIASTVNNIISANSGNINSLGTEAENTLFRQGLKKFKSGKYEQNDNIVVLEETPLWLYNKGVDWDTPITLNMDKLADVMKEPKSRVNGVNQHGITMDIVEQLPEAIKNPLNVIKNPQFNDRYVIVTSLTDQYGDIVI